MGLHPAILIDEISEAELTGELVRREKIRRRGFCDYCERHPDTKSCKFPDRHHDPRIDPPLKGYEE